MDQFWLLYLNMINFDPFNNFSNFPTTRMFLEWTCPFISHSVWVIPYESRMSHKRILIFRILYENQQKWLSSAYRIKKKPLPPISNDWEFRAPIFHQTDRPNRIISSKKLFNCKICGKKLEFRRSLQRHITSVHKVKCVVDGCQKHFWRPMPGKEANYNKALLRHNMAKHFSTD